MYGRWGQLTYLKQTEVTCETCGKKFMKKNAWIRKSKHHYCSYSCNGKQRIKEIPYEKICNPMQECQKERQKVAWTGANNPSWKGGVTYSRCKGNYKGTRYIRCPNEYLPMARKDGYIMEHRLVVAKVIGRLLGRKEVVHHIDHNSYNNSISNLMLFEDNEKHKRYENGQNVEILFDGRNV